jgi:putative thioredoxin
MSDSSPLISEAARETFQRDVVERSRDVPVVIDFWAAWCQPCRMLAPVLERLARAYDGRFLLVKADTERVPDIAAGFGVRSIPAVFGLRDGQVVDSFVGVLPEAAIRAWIDRLLPTPAEILVAEARRVEATDPPAAEAKLREGLSLAPHEPRAQIALARLLAAGGRDAEALGLLAALQRRGFLEPEAEALKAELELRARAAGAGGVAACRAELAAHPDDPAARLKLAEALAACGTYPEALDLCLGLVERHRKGPGEEARKTMLRIFQLLPADSELAAEYRRKLALALY